MNYWFALDEETFISTVEDKGLLYNSATYKYLKFNHTGKIKACIDQFLDLENLYCIKINQNDLKDAELNKFVKAVVLKKMGLCTPVSVEASKPIALAPILNLQKDIERSESLDYHYTGQGIVNNLLEITLFVNGECNQHCPKCLYMYKQIPFCTKSKKAINYDKLCSFLDKIPSGYLDKINICGGNIFEYEMIHQLFEKLDRSKSEKTVFCSYLNVSQEQPLLKWFLSELFHLQILVYFPVVDQDQLIECFNLNQQNQYYLSYLFVVTSLSEYEASISFVEKYQLSQYEIKPYYNGKNMEFFRDNIFITENDIFQSRLNKRQVFAIQKLNTNFFGKLTIFSEQNVYANINHPAIGALDDSIYELLFKEMTQGISWRNTRYQAIPCKDCIYKLLCPSLSNYEIAIGQSNLCHLKP